MFYKQLLLAHAFLISHFFCSNVTQVNKTISFDVSSKTDKPSKFNNTSFKNSISKTKGDNRNNDAISKTYVSTNVTQDSNTTLIYRSKNVEIIVKLTNATRIDENKEAIPKKTVSNITDKVNKKLNRRANMDDEDYVFHNDETIETAQLRMNEDNSSDDEEDKEYLKKIKEKETVEPADKKETFFNLTKELMQLSRSKLKPDEIKHKFSDFNEELEKLKHEKLNISNDLTLLNVTDVADESVNSITEVTVSHSKEKEKKDNNYIPDMLDVLNDYDGENVFKNEKRKKYLLKLNKTKELKKQDYENNYKKHVKEYTENYTSTSNNENIEVTSEISNTNENIKSTDNEAMLKTEVSIPNDTVINETTIKFTEVHIKTTPEFAKFPFVSEQSPSNLTNIVKTEGLYDNFENGYPFNNIEKELVNEDIKATTKIESYPNFRAMSAVDDYTITTEKFTEFLTKNDEGSLPSHITSRRYWLPPISEGQQSTIFTTENPYEIEPRIDLTGADTVQFSNKVKGTLEDFEIHGRGENTLTPETPHSLATGSNKISIVEADHTFTNEIPTSAQTHTSENNIFEKLPLAQYADADAEVIVFKKKKIRTLDTPNIDQQINNQEYFIKSKYPIKISGKDLDIYTKGRTDRSYSGAFGINDDHNQMVLASSMSQPQPSLFFGGYRRSVADNMLRSLLFKEMRRQDYGPKKIEPGIIVPVVNKSYYLINNNDLAYNTHEIKESTPNKMLELPDDKLTRDSENNKQGFDVEVNKLYGGIGNELEQSIAEIKARAKLDSVFPTTRQPIRLRSHQTQDEIFEYYDAMIKEINSKINDQNENKEFLGTTERNKKTDDMNFDSSENSADTLLQSHPSARLSLKSAKSQEIPLLTRYPVINSEQQSEIHNNYNISSEKQWDTKVRDNAIIEESNGKTDTESNFGTNEQVMRATSLQKKMSKLFAENSMLIKTEDKKSIESISKEEKQTVFEFEIPSLSFNIDLPKGQISRRSNDNLPLHILIKQLLQTNGFPNQKIESVYPQVVNLLANYVSNLAKYILNNRSVEHSISNRTTTKQSPNENVDKPTIYGHLDELKALEQNLSKERGSDRQKFSITKPTISVAETKLETFNGRRNNDIGAELFIPIGHDMFIPLKMPDKYDTIKKSLDEFTLQRKDTVLTPDKSYEDHKNQDDKVFMKLLPLLEAMQSADKQNKDTEVMDLRKHNNESLDDFASTNNVTTEPSSGPTKLTTVSETVSQKVPETSIVPKVEFFNILKKQTELMSELLVKIKLENSRRSSFQDFQKILTEIEGKKVGSITTERIEDLNKRFGDETKTPPTTVMTLIDETQVRRALMGSPYIRRILQLSKQKREKYLNPEGKTGKPKK